MFIAVVLPVIGSSTGIINKSGWLPVRLAPVRLYFGLIYLNSSFDLGVWLPVLQAGASLSTYFYVAAGIGFVLFFCPN